MFRAFHKPLLAKVPYATLFGYNPVLQSVFEAPAEKVALTVELPGQPVRDYTYGRLQRDVVALSNAVVRRREVVATARGASTPLSWSQPHKPAGVRSVFAQGERTASCDVLKDTGIYNAAVMCGPGYPFVVSLLALWATNHMAVPIHVSSQLDAVLTDSRARLLLSSTTDRDDTTADAEEGSPKETSPFARLSVHRMADAAHLTKQAAEALRHDANAVRAQTFSLEAVFDMTALLREQALVNERVVGDDAGHTLEVEWLAPAEDAFSTVIESADDVVARLEKEKAAAEDREFMRQMDLLKVQHREKHRVAESQPPLCFDTDALHELNPLHRDWLERPSTRPTLTDDCTLLYGGGSPCCGAVHTHASLCASVQSLAKAWRLAPEDSVLVHLPAAAQQPVAVLPLMATLAAHGALVLPTSALSDAALLAQRLTRGDVTALAGSADVYADLTRAVARSMSRIEQTGFRNTINDQVRFCGCVGPMPMSTHNAWHGVSRHFIASSVATVEAGLALVQPLRGPATPPGMTLTDTSAGAAVVVPTRTPGEEPATQDSHSVRGQLLLSSATLMDRYWHQPVETTHKMVEDASTGRRFCKTGMTVVETMVGKAPDTHQPKVTVYRLD